MIWWQAIVFSLHLLSGLDPSVREFELRLFSDSKLILDARVQRNPQTNSFRILAEGFPSPAILERSRLFGQVYTVFSPWDLSLDATDTQDDQDRIGQGPTDRAEMNTANGQPIAAIDQAAATSSQSPAQPTMTEEASSPDPQFATGAYPPSIVDLTALLVQASVTGSGRYTFAWPYSTSEILEQAAAELTQSESDPKESDASVLIDRRGLTLSIPDQKLVLNLFLGQ